MGTRSQEQQVGDDRIAAATGRSRSEWYTLLDEVGARAWDHARIARWLGGEHDVDGWWAQSVTVGYEQTRGMRLPGQSSAGHFEANATKVLHAGPETVWPHLAEEDLRSDWLDVDWHLVGMTEPRSLRLQADDGSRVTLLLTPLTPGRDGRPKVQLSVQHSRLPDGDVIDETKKFWRAALTRLAETVG